MEDKFYWPDSHQRILNIFESKYLKGANVFYISGNHDDPLRDQSLLEEIIQKDEVYKKIIGVLKKFEHKERHDFVVSELNQIEGVECKPTDGTFYVFPSFKNFSASFPMVAVFPTPLTPTTKITNKFLFTLLITY